MTRQALAAFRAVLRPGAHIHLEWAAPGNITRIRAVVAEILDDLGLPRIPATLLRPDIVFDLVQAAGFDCAAEGVRAVAQERAFTRAGLLAFVEAFLFAYRGDERFSEIIGRIRDRAEELRRHGTYDQVFVRNEVLATAVG